MGKATDSQWHCGNVRDVAYNVSDFTQQDYQVQCATDVQVGQVGLLQAPTTW